VARLGTFLHAVVEQLRKRGGGGRCRMFTVPSLRARDCDKNEKDALNYAFIVRGSAHCPLAPPAHCSVVCCRVATPPRSTRGCGTTYHSDAREGAWGWRSSSR
jgi:hypothetical protein